MLDLAATHLTLLNTHPFPTHDAGHTLDLALGAPPPLVTDGASTTVAPDLECGSDHRPLVTTVPTCTTIHRRNGSRLALNTTDPDTFLTRLHQSLPPEPTSLNSTADLDHYSTLLTQAFHTSLRQSTKIRQETRGLPYWNQECQDAANTIREAQRSWSSANTARDLHASRDWLRSARNRLRRSLGAARRTHWHDRITGATQPDEVCRLAGWRRRGFRAAMQPLVDPSNLTSCDTPKQKQDLLMRTFTDPAGLAPDDLHLPPPADTPTPFQFPPPPPLHYMKLKPLVSARRSRHRAPTTSRSAPSS